MNKVISALALLLSFNAFAATSGPLDGKEYCRTVVSDGMFGQPKGERKHCVKFDKGVASDDANTFFGNPPEYAGYEVSGNRVAFGSSVYDLSADQETLTTISGSTQPGIVLSLQK